MDITSYADTLRRELAVAAEAGGDEARELAARLVAPLESAVRLTLLAALSDAADEITRELAPGSVELRLRAGAPSFVVTTPPADDQPPAPSRPAVASWNADDGATSRINFRPPEQLKARIEEAAAREGMSVNAWLVRATAAAVAPAEPAEPRAPRFGQRYTGWVH